MRPDASTSLKSTIALAIVLAFAASAAIAQGGPPPGAGGGGGGGGKPPGGETAVNNLSFPAVEINNAGPVIQAFFAVTNPVLGQTYSYGCDKPEGEYKNTSCISPDGRTFYTAEQCTATGMPCAGLPVDRIYWQKTTANDWTADTSAAALGKEATHVDWGDNLESQTWWATATIRVETTAYGLGRTDPKQRGLQMWHVSGKGQTELWGARATDATPSLPYVYSADYAILHTTQARLNIAKMTTPEPCPTTPPAGPPLPQGSWIYTATGGYWQQSLLTLYDIPYTSELNIGGKYVNGFNWQLRRDAVAPEVGKPGWWRLTYYTRTGAAGSASAVTFAGPGITLTAAPDSVPAYPTLLDLTAAIAAEAETGPLYMPQVIGGTEHLSYIDICISDSKGGGGAKGGGRP